jgi:hypothetical protein
VATDKARTKATRLLNLLKLLKLAQAQPHPIAGLLSAARVNREYRLRSKSGKLAIFPLANPYILTTGSDNGTMSSQAAPPVTAEP